MTHYSKKHQELASDIVMALSCREAMTFDELANKLRLPKKLGHELCRRLVEWQVCRRTGFHGQMLIEMTDNVRICSERLKEIWVLGALHEDL